jgi:hypothetical protein
MVEDLPTAFDVYESFQCHLAKEEVSLVNLFEPHTHTDSCCSTPYKISTPLAAILALTDLIDFSGGKFRGNTR